MKAEIFIRADGNSQIGLGHLVRCLALANMLKTEFDITFFCKEIPTQIIEELKENQFTFKQIVEETEFIEEIKKDIIVVIDGYHFDTNYQKQIKARDAKLVCIDDVHDKEFYADLIINHAPGITPAAYKAQPFTKFALGHEYALLRPAFLEQAKQKRRIEKIETVLICFGGSDYLNLTEKSLKVITSFKQVKKIIVITGAAYQQTQSLLELFEKDNRIAHFHSLNADEMLQIMLETDLAIVPASGILFEVLAAGCIVITGSYVDNQNAILNGFNSLKAIYNTHDFSDLENCVKQVLSGKVTLNNNLIDGLSGVRLLQQIKLL